MKKLCSCVLIFILILSLTGCSMLRVLEQREDEYREYEAIRKELTVGTRPTQYTYPELETAPVGGEVGNLCPSYDLSLYFDEGTVSPVDSRGKVTVINFWYLYCSACVHELQTEFPLLREVYGDDLEIIVVHSSEEFGQDIPSWINDNLPDDSYFTYCRDAENDAFFQSVGGTAAWPLTIILDEEGIIRYKAMGTTTFDEMRGVIDELM